MKPPPPRQTPRPASHPSPYQPPCLQILGNWQVITLAYSVPINPGAVFNPVPQEN